MSESKVDTADRVLTADFDELWTIIDAVARGQAGYVLYAVDDAGVIADVGAACAFCERVDGVDAENRITHTQTCPVTLARKIKGLEPNNVTEC